jgi:hypothetical protein
MGHAVSVLFISSNNQFPAPLDGLDFKGKIWMCWRSPAGLYINPSLASAIGPCMNNIKRSTLLFTDKITAAGPEPVLEDRYRRAEEGSGDWPGPPLH